MSKTTFEKIGIPYEERDGIFYPVIVAGTEKADIDAGKYGRMWIKYIKEEYPMRYKSLVRFGELEERADEVNDTAYELLDDIEAKWLKKHKPKNPNSFTEQLQLRTQTRMMAEEIVIMDVVMQFHLCGGKKRPQNSKVTAKSATTQISEKKVMVAESAIKMEKWWRKTPLKQQSDGKKRHHISNCGGILTTTYHIQGAGAPAKTKNYVNADGVYIFSGTGPTFSTSCKTYEHIFKKGWKSNGTDKKRLV